MPPFDLDALIASVTQSSRTTPATDGVVLFSGGMDSVGMAIVGAKRGLDLLPVYMSHRANVGNVTKKEIVAARKLAPQITGHPLVVVKPRSASGRDPAWYGDHVLHSDKLPISKKRKPWRNRIFLEVLDEHGLLKGQIVLGLWSSDRTPHDLARIDDVTKEGLAKHARTFKRSGYTIVTAPTWGMDDKAAMLKELGRSPRHRQQIYDSESCLMYFNKPCGNCWSCVERAETILAAWGRDKTPYRPKSTAGRLVRKS